MIPPLTGPTASPRPLVPQGGSEQIENDVWPEPIQVSREEALRGLNPLHHLPVIGMIYRAATGESIPAPMRVAGAGIFGGPLGMIGAAFTCLLEELLRMGPDQSRPPTPAGMAQTGSEAGIEPVTPGTLSGGAYTTLATVVPDFLKGPNTVLVQNGNAAYQQASMEWQRSEWLEKGIV